jgi:hypothetical protein
MLLMKIMPVLLPMEPGMTIQTKPSGALVSG